MPLPLAIEEIEGVVSNGIVTLLGGMASLVMSSLAGGGGGGEADCVGGTLFTKLCCERDELKLGSILERSVCPPVNPSIDFTSEGVVWM